MLWIILIALFIWAIVHGGTRGKQPAPKYDCDPDRYDEGQGRV